MYTKLDDQRQAKFIVKYMQEHPSCSIKDIVQQCVTNRTRLKYLESQGYFSLPKLTHQDVLDSITNFYRLKYLEKEGFITLPKPLPFGERNGIARKNN